jgi:hypothetical protein
MCEGERDEVSGREEQKVTLKDDDTTRQDLNKRQGRHDRLTTTTAMRQNF